MYRAWVISSEFILQISNWIGWDLDLLFLIFSPAWTSDNATTPLKLVGNRKMQLAKEKGNFNTPKHKPEKDYIVLACLHEGNMLLKNIRNFSKSKIPVIVE